MDIDLTIRQTQKQTLSQQQRQALSLLQMPLPALENYIGAMLLENPLLERLGQESAAETAEMREEPESHSGGYAEPNPDGAGVSSGRGTLEEELSEQLLALPIDRARLAVLRFFVAELDEKGYLPESDEAYADILLLPVAEVSEDIALLQSLEPAGVFARSLGECLCLQLSRRGETDSLAYRIAKSHLDDVAWNRIETLARKLSVSADEVTRAIAVLGTLNPKPANGYDGGDPAFIVPDAELIEREGSFQVRCRRSPAFRIGLNNEYIAMLHSAEPDGELYAYLSEKRREGRFLLESIRRREETLAACTEAAVKRQRAYFMGGALVPLSLADVSSDVGLHISTVSRAFNGKYLLTGRGVIPFSRLFVRASSGDASKNDVTERIRRIIREENPEKPLSDAAIASRLRAEGLDVARRTVAKYREGLLLPPAAERRRGR